MLFCYNGLIFMLMVIVGIQPSRESNHYKDVLIKQRNTQTDKCT